MLKSLAPVAVFALIASAASASPAAHQAVVKIGDLDPAKPSTARVLQNRIQAAALKACGADEASLRVVKRSAERSDCYRQAVEQTRLAVGRQLAAN